MPEPCGCPLGWAIPQTRLTLAEVQHPPNLDLSSLPHFFQHNSVLHPLIQEAGVAQNPAH